MELLQGKLRSRRRAASMALALAAASGLLALGAGVERAAAATCPNFKVLHDDRIGPASLPAGSYTITTGAGMTCASASQLFSRFLQDWDGKLPNPWRVAPNGSGKANFMRGNALGFSVARSGGTGNGGSGESSRTPTAGLLCDGPFTVNASSEVGPLFFPKGQYVLYIPAGSGIGCNRASVLFTRFLGAPGGQLPFPWRVLTQTATFFKPQQPQRSAFRVESLS